MANITIEQVIEALLDEDKAFPAPYLQRLSDLSPADSKEIEKLWPRISEARRITLLEDLEQMGGVDDLLSFEEVCRTAIRDEVPAVRTLAIQILRAYDLTSFIPNYLYLMENDSSPEVRAVAAAALGSFVYMGEIEALAEKIQRRIEDSLLRVITGDDQKIVRRRALESLGFSSRDVVAPLIEKMVPLKDVDWQISTLIAMGRTADQRWKPQVLARLDDTRVVIRAGAAAAAGELELKEARRPLLKMLHDEEEDVRAAAIWSLSQIGGERVAEALEALLKTTQDDDEAELIEEALDNLAFTEEVRSLDLLGIPEDEQDEQNEEEQGEEDDDEWEDEEAEEDEEDKDDTA